MVKKIEETKEDVVAPTVNGQVVEEAPKVKAAEETPKPKKEDVVEIKRSDFEKMMKTLEKQSKDIELLYKTADKNRIAQEMNKGGEPLIRQAKISLLDDTDRLVVGWSDLLVNRCEVVMGKWIEEQTVNMVMDDGEIIPMSYLESVRRTSHKVLADIIGTSNDVNEKGVSRTIYKVQLPTGKVLLIDKTFINKN